MFDELAKQSGNPINWERTPKGLPENLSLSVSNRPYWEVLDQLCVQAKMSAQFYDDPFRLGVQLTRGEPGQFPHAVSGPLRMRLATCRRALNQELNYGDGQTIVAIRRAQPRAQLGTTVCDVPLQRPVAFSAVTDTGEDLRQNRRILDG